MNKGAGYNEESEKRKVRIFLVEGTKTLSISDSIFECIIK
jgi:hypothetical protein